MSSEKGAQVGAYGTPAYACARGSESVRLAAPQTRSSSGPVVCAVRALTLAQSKEAQALGITLPVSRGPQLRSRRTQPLIRWMYLSESRECFASRWSRLRR